MAHSMDTARAFDFDIGCLTKSPCRDCPDKNSLPRCATGCDLLQQIQSVLSSAVSCSRSPACYSVHLPFSGGECRLE